MAPPRGPSQMASGIVGNGTGEEVAEVAGVWVSEVGLWVLRVWGCA